MATRRQAAELDLPWDSDLDQLEQSTAHEDSEDPSSARSEKKLKMFKAKVKKTLEEPANSKLDKKEHTIAEMKDNLDKKERTIAEMKEKIAQKSSLKI